MTGRLKISGGLSLMDGHFTDYPGLLLRDTLGNPIPPGPINGRGRESPRLPKFSGNLSASYNLPTSVGEFDSTIGINYENGYYWEADNRLRQPAHTIVNSSVSWTPNDGPVSIKIWGKNLLNEYYFAIGNAGAFPVGDNQVPNPPRTYGVTLTYRYN